MSDLAEYRALLAKVEAELAATAARREADLACRRGCDACCHVELTVSVVEAAAIREALAELDPDEREAVATRAAAEADGRCVMLREDGACAIYAGRPLVCRTQGHALRYPPGIVPEEAIRGGAGGGDVTWCPLNYTERAPAGEDVLEAGRIDEILALVNRRYAPEASEKRLSLRELASAPRA